MGILLDSKNVFAYLKSASGLQKVRDYLFATLAFPIGQFVGIVFWTLYNIDREIIFPVVLDKIYPNYINHMLHTTVMPVQACGPWPASISKQTAVTLKSIINSCFFKDLERGVIFPKI